MREGLTSCSTTVSSAVPRGQGRQRAVLITLAAVTTAGASAALAMAQSNVLLLIIGPILNALAVLATPKSGSKSGVVIDKPLFIPA
jgi:hypothetical protein